MNVRKFLDEYPMLYSGQPKRSAEDALKEGADLWFLKTEAGLIAVNRKAGCIFRKKKSPDKDNPSDGGGGIQSSQEEWGVRHE